MTDPGSLTATREGPHVRLDMNFPEGYDHSFMVERLDGTDPEGFEIWTPIHTGPNKFVQSDTDYELARPTNDDFLPLPGPRTYRALAYSNAEPDSNVLILHTQGVYTESASI